MNRKNIPSYSYKQEGLNSLKGLSFGAILFGLLLASPVNATDSFGQASDIFHVGVGARAMGMGGAFTGLADDASASYYNPAGLAYLDEHQLMAMYAPLFMDSNFNYLATANPLGDKWGAVSLSAAVLTSDKFEIRDENNTLTSSSGDLRNSLITASYAHKIAQQVSAGANFNLIQQSVVGYSDSTLGMDLGLMYRPSSLFSLGFALSNINSPEVKLDSEPDVYKPVMRVGLASEVYGEKLILTADAIKVQSEKNLYAAGVEFNPTNLFSLRGGFNANRSYTLGMGIKLDMFRIDYAFSDTDVGAFNKVSLTWAWHNIYKTDLDPPMKSGRAVFPLTGFENQVAFKASVPNHVVARWSLVITNEAGDPVRTLEADLRPPDVIGWDALNDVGEPVVEGKYNYTFLVNYKNGKTWRVSGDIEMDLPNRKLDEVIDMNLELNGARATEDDVQ